MKKKDFDIVGILLGVVIGFLLGYFISSRIIVNEIDRPVGGEKNEEIVYLLQIAKFDNPSGPVNYIKTLSEKGLTGVVVNEYSYYYVYGAIAESEEALANHKTLFESKGYTPIIRKEYIMNTINAIADDAIQYEFWKEGIENLIKNINGEAMTISEKYYLNPIDLEFFSNITMLSTIKNDAILNRIRLQCYKVIKETLS